MTATEINVTSVTKDSPGAGQVTIVGTYTTSTAYTTAPQQVSVGNFPSNTTPWSRYLLLSSDAVFCKRNGATAVSIATDSFAQIAYTLEPTLTFVPTITTEPSAASCVASSTAATFTVAADSEAAKTYQWQYETKPAGTLTSDNTAPSDGDTVTVGGVTYTFKTTLAGVAGQVLINGTADNALLNLIRAINHTGTPGTDYVNSGTTAVVNPLVRADAAVSSHAFTVYYITSGTTGNSSATTETSSHLSWGGATLSGGGTWNSASGTVRGCAFTNGTTVTLTCTPTTTIMSGTNIRCAVTNVAGTTNTDSAVLTIT